MDLVNGESLISSIHHLTHLLPTSLTYITYLHYLPTLLTYITLLIAYLHHLLTFLTYISYYGISTLIFQREIKKCFCYGILTL